MYVEISNIKWWIGLNVLVQFLHFVHGRSPAVVLCRCSSEVQWRKLHHGGGWSWGKKHFMSLKNHKLSKSQRSVNIEYQKYKHSPLFYQSHLNEFSFWCIMWWNYVSLCLQWIVHRVKWDLKKDRYTAYTAHSYWTHSICVTGCDKGMQCSSVAAHSLELAEDVGVLGWDAGCL